MISTAGREVKVSAPRLPVPPLRQTLDAYLESLEPFLEDLSLQSGRAKEELVAERRTWAADFETGIGKLCQKRLLDIEANSRYNWLDDNFWTKKAYHEVRLPLLIHSNWWLALAQDHALKVSAPEPIYEGSCFTMPQVQRAAWMIHGFVSVKQQISSNLLYPVVNGKEHWVRRPALNIYTVYRTPRLVCDVFAQAPPPGCLESRSVALLLNGQVCALEVEDSSGSPIEPGSLFRGICAAIEATELNKRSSSLGILTTTDRDIWASNYNHLVSLSSQNKENMRIIEATLFAVALDTSEDLPISQPIYDRGSRHDSLIRSIRSGKSAKNRWLDKGFTLIFTPDGECGMSGEHSPCDALVPSMVADEALKVTADISVFKHENPLELPNIAILKWDIDERLEAQCTYAAQNAQALIEDSDYSLLWFDEFGTDWMSEAKIPPDAFIQLALQLAWYKDQKCFTAVYETALTRSFLHGRTETIRSYTSQARKFIEAVTSGTASKEEISSLFKDAVRAHVALTRRAVLGRGIDRHLMGLRLVMGMGENSPLFSDPLFFQSQRWLLSTSGLSEGQRFIGTGFGSYQDGYGINYMPAPDTIRFGIESKHSSANTSTRRFKRFVVEALNEMRVACAQSDTFIEARL